MAPLAATPNARASQELAGQCAGHRRTCAQPPTAAGIVPPRRGIAPRRISIGLEHAPPLPSLHACHAMDLCHVPATGRRLAALSFPIGKQMPTHDFKRLSCTQSKSTTKPMTRKVDAHTRDERARDGVSRDEMRGVEWAAEGAPNGLRAQGPMMTPVGCDVRHTSRARVCWHLTRVRSRGTRCHPHLRSARAWPANQGGTASLTVGPSLMH